MLPTDLYRTSVRSLNANKGRSLLTMLGIIIGVGSVVLMVSVGRTLEAYILDQIEALGGNLIDVYPTGLEKFGRATDTITQDDYRAIERLTTVENVAPVIFLSDKLIYGTEEDTPTIFGTNENILENFGSTIDKGRLLDERDLQSAKNVVVLGAETANNLFGRRNPINKKVKIGNRSFTVVGVLRKAGSLLLSDLDNYAYIPYTTARSMSGKKHVDYISLRAKADDALARADITLLLRERHGIKNPDDDPDKDDFMARSAEQATEIVGSVTLGLTIFLGLVAGISLLVGGIGIMNIMLVAVSERTMEIGLRKAVGARRRDILLQFLIEAVWLTSIGGTIGILGGGGLAFLITILAGSVLGEVRFVLSFPALLSAILMAVGTGLIFGIYPAKKAAELSPIDAMRLE